MPIARFALVPFYVVLMTASSAWAQTAADAQSSQPALEIQGEYGGHYWIVETAPDGSRRGAWISKQIPLDRVDRKTLEPIPRQNTQQQTPQQQSPVSFAQSGPTSQVERPRLPQTPSATGRLSHTRDGFWFNAGIGIGFAGCQGCLGRDPGASGGLSLGTTINDKVLLGVGTSGWYRSYANGVTLGGGTTDLRVRFYPSLRSGLFVTGGLGLGTVRVGLGSVSETHYGVGSVFGAGWDIRLRPNISMTPFYNGFAVQTSYDQGYVDQFGIGITVH
jgi:hypothetical protein